MRNDEHKELQLTIRKEGHHKGSQTLEQLFVEAVESAPLEIFRTWQHGT